MEPLKQDPDFKVHDRRHEHAPAEPDTATTQTLPFQAEMKQLLDLFIRSVYSSKEVFLRELISNASDALDRLRFEALTDPKLRDDGEPEIRIETDAKARTLTILDNGIGMSRDEVIANIGTIARSGTRELAEKIKESKSGDETLALIGKFGVGFYSAFIVAQKVTLVTKRAGADAATIWESTGDGSYTIGPTTKSGYGTTVTLHLRAVDAEDGVADFTDEHVLSDVVKRHSDFVRYPIRMKVPVKDADASKQATVEDKMIGRAHV